MAKKDKPKVPSMDELAGKLSLETMVNKIHLPHGEARKTFTDYDLQIKDYAKFTSTLTKYIKHHTKAVEKRDLSDEEALGYAISMLDSAFQKEGGHTYAFRIANQGHMDDVLDKIKTVFAAQHEHRYKSAIKAQIDPTNFEQQVEFAKQYIDKYADLLPKGKKKKKPEQLAKDYEDLIEQHTHTIDTITEYIGSKGG